MIRTLALLVVSALALIACTGEQKPKAVTYTLSEFIGPSPFHGLHGLAVEPDGTILAGSVVGQAIYAVNPATGEVATRMGPPDGMADDIAFADDGTMAWTAFLLGKVYIRKPNGKTIEVANGMSGPNSIAFGKDGRLFVSEVFLGDALYEIDLKNVDKPDFKPFPRAELRRIADETRADLSGQPDALGFAAAERAALAIQRQITEADIAQEAEARADFLDDVARDFFLKLGQLQGGEKNVGFFHR